MTDPLAQLLACPRDTTIVIENAPQLARGLMQRGLHVVHVGELLDDVASAKDIESLSDGWNVLSRRVPFAAVLGSQQLKDRVLQLRHQTAVNNNTSVCRARGWVEQMLSNLWALRRPLAMQMRGCEGLPAFIVGAGPELDRNVAELERAQQKGLVIGINAAARAPVHAALTVESNDLRHKLGPLDNGVLRLFGTTSHPEVMGHGDGPLLPVYCGELSKTLTELTGHVQLYNSGNGGTAAVSLVERLGCNPIVLVGQGFGYPQGQSRVYPECLGIGDSTLTITGNAVTYDWAESHRQAPRHNPLTEYDEAVQVPGVDGSEAWCPVGMLSPRIWMQSAGERLKLDHRLVNASEGGSVLDNWETRRLTDVLDELPDRPVRFELPRDGVPAEMLTAWVDGYLHGVEGVRRAAKRMRSATDRQMDRAAAEFEHAVGECQLIEPWMHARVADAMLGRRSEAPGAKRPEWRAACETGRALADAVLRELPEFEGVLLMAKGRVAP